MIREQLRGGAVGCLSIESSLLSTLTKDSTRTLVGVDVTREPSLGTWYQRADGQPLSFRISSR